MAERVSEGVTLNQSACLVPSKSTTAATPAVLVDDSAAVFANTNTDTDTVVKATSDGAAIVELARGNGAPDEFSYEVDLRPGLQVVELANDGVAIIDPSAQPDQGTPPSVSPGARENLGEVLTDAELQQDIGESELASAESELGVDVVSVLEAPIAYSETASTSLTDASENTAANGRKGKIHKVGPAKIKVTVPPPPPTPVKKQAVVVLTHNDFDKVDCERGSSPCGDFHVGPAVDYAMTYGPEDRPQSRFYDYESNDCTNFMSQILFMGGGMKWMGEYGGTSGAWYARGNPLGSPGAAPDGRYLTTHTWTVADDMARHMYKYGFLRVVPNATQNDFRRGDLIIMNWWEGSNHSRDDHYDHFQFVTNSGEGSRDPTMAQHSSNDYAAFTWTTVKQRIRNAGHGVVGNGWSFKVLRPVNTGANIDAVVRNGGDL